MESKRGESEPYWSRTSITAELPRSYSPWGSPQAPSVVRHSFLLSNLENIYRKMTIDQQVQIGTSEATELLILKPCRSNIPRGSQDVPMSCIDEANIEEHLSHPCFCPYNNASRYSIIRWMGRSTPALRALSSARVLPGFPHGPICRPYFVGNSKYILPQAMFPLSRYFIKIVVQRERVYYGFALGGNVPAWHLIAH